MKPVFYGIVVVGALLIWEAIKGLQAVKAGGVSTSTGGATTGGSGCVQSIFAGVHYTEDQLRQFASNAGFAGGALDQIVAIAERESSGWSQARCVNTSGSVDRGVLQFNNQVGPVPLTDSQADDPQTAFNAAYQVVRGPAGFTPWAVH